MLSIRKVEEKDAKTLFNWANHPLTRANSLNSNSISWEEHTQWLSRKLNSNDALFFMVIDESSKNVGFVRFEKKDTWVVGIVVSPDEQGKGIGKDALGLSISEFNKYVSGPIFAYIKNGNAGSIKIFEHNLFFKVEDGEVLLYKREL